MCIVRILEERVRLAWGPQALLLSEGIGGKRREEPRSPVRCDARSYDGKLKTYKAMNLIGGKNKKAAQPGN